MRTTITPPPGQADVQVLQDVADGLRRGHGSAQVLLALGDEERAARLAAAAGEVYAPDGFAAKTGWVLAGAVVGTGVGLALEKTARQVVGFGFLGAGAGFVAHEVWTYLREHTVAQITYGKGCIKVVFTSR